MAGSFAFGNNNIYTSSLPDTCLTTAPFQDESYPKINGHDFYQSDLQPFSPSWDAFIANPPYATPDKEYTQTTSNFFNQDDLLFADSSLEESPQTPKLSARHISLFPLQADRSCDPRDSFASSGSTPPLIDHMSFSHVTSPSATKSERPTVSESNYSEKSSRSTSSESEKPLSSSRRSSKGSAHSPTAHRLNHNKIEKRYRTNLSQQISNLWSVIATEEKSDSRQPSKSAVLVAARKYILELQMHNKRAESNLEEGRKKCKTYEQLLTNNLRKTGVKVARIGRP
ncbi:hypothetical protein BKA64DRAFT_380480 [Cadophora sp. MPI-SDFR-AT-0126]|nr:hypothetical protein BKA64DRAFT_380480 [Leotiomycetes sp. MPI-SDFR-AT-0126]